jgi:hypothetical protein
MGAFFGIRPIIGAVAALSIAACFAAPAATASTPFVDIHSAGPLTDIYIGNDLGCQVRSGGFSSTEYYPNASGPGDCGTFLYLNSDTIPNTLFGPDFANHTGGTHTSGFPIPETPFTVSAGNQSFTGTGTAASPYRVTTTVTGTVLNQSGGTVALQISEVDSYIVGNNFYETDVTVKNIGGPNDASLDEGAELYHAADCQLRGLDTGLGAFEPNSQSPITAACTPNVLGNPPSALEEFTPITAGASWEQTTVPTIWANLDGSALNNNCNDCRVAVDNAEGIEYPVPDLSPGQSSSTISFDTNVVDTVPSGGFSFTGSTSTAVGGIVATITDPNTSATASAYSASINWGDGTMSTGTITGGGGSFNVSGNHSYSTAGTYPVSVTITSVGTSQGSSTVTDSATITAPPAPVITGAPTVTGPNGAAFSGSVNPDGLATTAYFQYGIPTSAQGPGGLGPTFTQFTPTQAIGSDFSNHAVSASVSGLVPHELYDVQLVATNSAGTTYGPVESFTTQQNAAPPPPVLGKQVNVTLVSGYVWIKPPPGKSLGPAGDNAALSKGQGFVPLTEARQVPTGSEVDALHGSLRIVSNTGTVGKTQTATLAGGVFNVSQVRKGISKGLTNFNLVESAFQGAPTYNTCKAKYEKAGDATIASLSSKTLQLLKVSGHGKFKTTGRFSSATVRGTIYTVADRCDGTLTHVIRDTVLVDDFVRHKTILLHAGQSYLAKKP